MLNFTYKAETKILFGTGTEKHAGAETAALCNGKRVLLHYGGGSIKKSGLYDTVTASLRESGVLFTELGGVVPNPRLSLVREGIRICREQDIGFILAVGGGSVIDSAKAIAAGVLYDGDVWDFFSGQKGMLKALSIGVVLTIPAAGSESSDSCVITNDELNLKRGSGGDAIVPRFAILNPELTYTLPPYQTACGAADIFAHLMERYFTGTDHVEYSDRLLEASMKTVMEFAPLAVAHPDNYDIRAQMMWVGKLAHDGLFDRGRIGDWGSHGIEHELSAEFDIAHGAGLAIVFPAWMRFVYTRNLPRFTQFAVRVMNVDASLMDPERVILEGIARLESFFRSIGLPTRLTMAPEITSTEDALLRKLAEKAVYRGSAGAWGQLNADEVFEVFKLAM